MGSIDSVTDAAGTQGSSYARIARGENQSNLNSVNPNGETLESENYSSKEISVNKCPNSNSNVVTAGELVGSSIDMMDGEFVPVKRKEKNRKKQETSGREVNSKRKRAKQGGNNNGHRADKTNGPAKKVEPDVSKPKCIKAEYEPDTVEFVDAPPPSCSAWGNTG